MSYSNILASNLMKSFFKNKMKGKKMKKLFLRKVRNYSRNFKFHEN